MANKKILAIMCCAVLINIAHAQRNAEFGKLTDARDGTVKIDSESDRAKAELEQEANKWQNNFYHIPTKTSEFFTFAVKEGLVDETTWTATSKVKIGDCPAKSVWEMYLHSRAFTKWGNKIPPKCKSITPKVITDYDGEDINDDFD